MAWYNCNLGGGLLDNLKPIAVVYKNDHPSVGSPEEPIVSGSVASYTFDKDYKSVIAIAQGYNIFWDLDDGWTSDHGYNYGTNVQGGAGDDVYGAYLTYSKGSGSEFSGVSEIIKTNLNGSDGKYEMRPNIILFNGVNKGNIISANVFYTYTIEGEIETLCKLILLGVE